MILMKIFTNFIEDFLIYKIVEGTSSGDTEIIYVDTGNFNAPFYNFYDKSKNLIDDLLILQKSILLKTVMQ